MLSIFPPWENFIPSVGKFHSQRGKMNNLHRARRYHRGKATIQVKKTSKISHFFAVFAPNLSLLHPICSA
jgi:hypothetical protein